MPQDVSMNFSFIELFLRADYIGKSVMILLVLASIGCWAIIFDKAIRLMRLTRLSNDFEDIFWSGQSLEDIYKRIPSPSADPMSSVFVAGMREWARSVRAAIDPTSLQSRIDRAMSVTLVREMEELEKYMGFLASVGSTATFAGLFGTVWGIMNALQSIAFAKNTTLAAVAPGMAEALMATALGLLTAIPALIAYNKFTNDLGRYAKRLESFATELSSILSRRSDEKAA